MMIPTFSQGQEVRKGWCDMNKNFMTVLATAALVLATGCVTAGTWVNGCYIDGPLCTVCDGTKVVTHAYGTTVCTHCDGTGIEPPEETAIVENAVIVDTWEPGIVIAPPPPPPPRHCHPPRPMVHHNPPRPRPGGGHHTAKPAPKPAQHRPAPRQTARPAPRPATRPAARPVGGHGGGYRRR